MKLILIGFAACYKTSAGKILAEKFGLPFCDVDQEIESAQGRSVQQIFDQCGEEFFRNAESETLLKLKNFQGVVSCGGGSVLSPNFAEFKQGGKVVWLTATAETIKSRLTMGRPLFDGLTVRQLQQKLALREKLYSPLADFCVQTDEKTSAQVADEIFALLN